MSRNRNIYITVVVLAMLVAGVMGLAIYQQWRVSQGELGLEEPPDVSEYNAYLYEEPRDIRDFNLTDEQDEAVDKSMFEGQWTIAFVGFTYCPDICPATMATLSQAADEFPDEVTDPQILLISADPERDTPEQLNQYVTFFGDTFRGVTGDYDVLERLARDLNAVFMHNDDADGEKAVDHSSHLALISPHGELVGMIQPPHDVESIVRVYEAVHDWVPQRR